MIAKQDHGLFYVVALVGVHSWIGARTPWVDDGTAVAHPLDSSSLAASLGGRVLSWVDDLGVGMHDGAEGILGGVPIHQLLRSGVTRLTMHPYPSSNIGGV